MELSFPCVGNIDDGIFDLGLDDDSYDEGVHARRADSSSRGHHSRVLSPDALDQLLAFTQGDEEGCSGSGDEGDDSGGGGTSSVLTQSPFCDAAIATPPPEALAAANASKTRNPKDDGQAASVANNKNSAVIRMSHSVNPSLDFAEGANASFDAGPRAKRAANSPLVSPIRWPPPRETRAGGGGGGGAGAGGSGDISNAFPPRLPIVGFDKGHAPSLVDTTRLVASEHRRTKIQSSSNRILAGNGPDGSPLIADGAGAQWRWARQRAASCEAAVVAASVRKEEEALAEANTATTAPAGAAHSASETLASCAPSSGGYYNSSGRATKHNVSTGTTPVGEKRKVSFASQSDSLEGGKDDDDDDNNDDDVNGDDEHSDGQLDGNRDTRGGGGDGWGGGGGEGARGGGGGEGGGGGDDDLLARASELHSSVAGQLRSVNELLKRKSYIYIDTSWSAKQLPCPPTAWKGKACGTVGDGCTASHGGAGDGGAGMGIERSAINNKSKSRMHPSATHADRPAAAFSTDANNVVVRLEGRWVSAGPNKPNVGFHSISGKKATERMGDTPHASAWTVCPSTWYPPLGVEVLHQHCGTGCDWCAEVAYTRRSCQQLHRHLASGAAGDCTRSGTTLCAAVLAGRRLTVANVGDSGCLRLSYRTALATSSPPSPGTAPSTTAAADADADADAAPGRLGLGIRRGDDDVAAAAGSKSGRRRRVRTVHTAKVGASEVGARVRGRSRGGLVAERLSRDHKPENKGELERIQAAGGIVFPLPRTSALGDGDGYREGGSVAGEAKKSKHGRHRAANTREQGLATARDFGAEVPRVWATNGEGPGLAMSRSIGDKMAHSAGVTHEPEITEIDLDPRRDVMLVLASDGVWDVLSAEDIRKTAEAHVIDQSWCPQALSVDICRKSLSQWAAVTSGGSDDITCLIVKTGGGALPPPVPTRMRRNSSSVTAADAA